MLARIPGARVKRTALSWFGSRLAHQQARGGFPGNDWLAGTTDPPWVKNGQFFVRWLTAVPGRVVELACHPGHLDPTLVGRDCTADDGLLQRRVDELRLLLEPSFAEAVQRAGFTPMAPAEYLDRHLRGRSYAA
jgi:hypothetical protein